MTKLIIGQNDVDLRLDTFLSRKYKVLKKNLIYKLIRVKKIKVNNKKVDFSYHLKLNDEIFIYANVQQENTNQVWLNADNKLDIVYEDDNIIVMNKPIKLECIDQSNLKYDTLINRLKKYLYKSNQWDPNQENYFTPCLVHRIDTNTRGLVVGCKNRKSADILNQKIKNHEINKYYLCAVYGKIPKTKDTLNAFLFKSKDNSNIVKISNKQINPNYKDISTYYEVLEYNKKNNISYLVIKLITGRTHQIRAHLNFIGHSLVGEQKYILPEFSEINKKFKHQFLIHYMMQFNFSNDADILNYLRNKKISLDQKSILNSWKEILE